MEYTVEHVNGEITKALDVMGLDGSIVQGNTSGDNGVGGDSRGGGGFGGGAYDDDRGFKGSGYGCGGGWNESGSGGQGGGCGGGGSGSYYKYRESGHFTRDYTINGGGDSGGGHYYQCGVFVLFPQDCPICEALVLGLWRKVLWCTWETRPEWCRVDNFLTC